MDEIYKAVIIASFQEVALELRSMLNRDSEIDPNTRIKVKQVENQIHVESYIMWDDVSDPYLTTPKPLAYLGYVERLSPEDDYTKPVQIRVMQPKRYPSQVWEDFKFHLDTCFLVNDITGKDEDLKSKPWLIIPENGWNRKAVELWHKGYTGPQIANKVGVSKHTVNNVMSKLRDKYGEHVVPYHRRV